MWPVSDRLTCLWPVSDLFVTCLRPVFDLYCLVMKGEDNTGNIMVMLPNGEQGVVVTQDELGGMVQQPGDAVAEADNKVYVMDGLEVSNGSNLPSVVTSVNGFNPMQKPKFTESSSMIKIVGIQDKKPQQISVVKVSCYCSTRRPN